MAADDAAEGKADEMERLRRELLQALRQNVGEAARVEGQGRQLALAHARQVAGQHPEMRGQRFDIAQPVCPGAEGAVQQQHGAPGAPFAPDQAAVAAGRLMASGRAVEPALKFGHRHAWFRTGR